MITYIKFAVSLIMILNANLVLSQTETKTRQTFTRVYSNFKKGISGDDRSANFEIRRIYIGYKGEINDYFSAEIKLDIGSPDDLSRFSLIRRYAYFKTASVTYKKDGLTGWFGLFDMQQFKLQEDFWGYRYIYKSFQDEYKFGPSADMGAGLKYDLTGWLSVDLILSNGEGYRNYEHDNFIKYGGGLTLKPFKDYILRIYYDYIHSDMSQKTFTVFSGFNRPGYRIGGEYNIRNNSQFLIDQDLKGYSAYATWIINNKWELFARYDRLTSNLLQGEETPWNLYNDGTSIITGCQFSPTDGLKTSLNYQDRFSLARNGPDKAYIYINLQFDL